jgi:hypothetical protein
MSEWISLDSDELNPERQENIRGVEVSVFYAPYDVPIAVRGYYDNNLKRFVIEFQYTEPEQYKVKRDVEHIYVRVGKESQRLYGFEIDVDALNVNEVSLRVAYRELKAALNNLIREPLSPRRKGNYQVISDALTANRDKVFSALAGS